jgi:hypothetical protein
MKKTYIIGLGAIIILAVAFYPLTSLAGVAIGEMAKMYNTNTVTTVKCVVVESGQVEMVRGPIMGSSYGINLKVSTSEGTLTVYLGPSWFIERQDMKFKKDDIIEVKGCKKIYEGKSVIVAQEISKGSLTLKLRDESGAPVWTDKQTAITEF